MRQLVTVDFETEGIDGNPVWVPPVPVGVSIKIGERPSTYYAFGHPTENNCNHATAVSELRKHWDGPLLFQNAPFDLSVAYKHLGLPWPKNPLLVHDTMYLLFLQDPYAKTFSLKPSAERYLGLKPVERDAVRDWVLAHVPGARAAGWGTHIGRAPGALVGTYAAGDTDRTYELFQHLHPMICQQGMEEAYQREQRLMPILCEASRRGVPVARDRLAADIPRYEAGLIKSENTIYQLLGVSCDNFNIDSDQQMVEALDNLGAVEAWHYTEKGAKSMSKKVLQLRPEFADLRMLLSYRGAMNTCLTTFCRPWLGLSSEDGNLHPEWNQTRGDRSKDSPNGTRTGRLSCSNPNFQNIPNIFDVKVPPGYPTLPNMKDYVLPPEGHTWLKRDFSAQEMRIMSHFAEGKLAAAFNADPKTDPHALVQAMIKEMLDIDLPRKHVKTTSFGIMYGRGVQSTADALDISYDGAKELKDAYYEALPEVRVLEKAVKARGKSGQAIKTWGGRRYFREQWQGDGMRDLSYKLLNYLIQGSAADQTKEAIIQWDATRHPTDLFMATVHDEVCIAAPIKDEFGAMSRLKEAMNMDIMDVPFMSDGFKGSTWGQLEEYI